MELRGWLTKAWDTVFDERARGIIEARAAGCTLEEAGARFGVTRERARQIISEGQCKLAIMVDVMVPAWRTVAQQTGAAPAVRREDLAVALRAEDHVILEVLLIEAGLRAPRTWAGPLRGWWTTDPDELDRRLLRLVDRAPVRGDDLDEEARVVGMPEGVNVAELLDDPRSRVVRDAAGHWVRRKVRRRDSAYLHLLDAGRPCRAEDLIEPMGVTSVAAAREGLRRDDRFVQVRPEGTWALAEWSHLRVAPYGNAIEAVVAVVTERGPITQRALFSEVRQMYPVTASRLRQCLLSDQLGRTPDGLIDLVARGAQPIEEPEPPRPDSMAVQGDVLGVRIPVDRDVLRGSGVRVHSWLTWRLGLRQTPMRRTFATAGGHAPLTVTRAASFAQVSTLRRHVIELGAVEGCVLAVILDLAVGTARVRHGCAPGECQTSLVDSRSRADQTLRQPGGQLTT
ncbi:RNA polymerase subunit sigma-70 [Streptomyces sp. SID4928]|uniref:sigma factor-like helix-turn-helix DNA-binding protein n=1 Tax=unclassified Streptomyces TaxID=2593676 RepID=UPI0001C19B62|nr:sigma factor-like helix-turn-helix DNA-binding protein [Streptomyces sp. ACT-1]EGE41253.1 sigma-70 region 4 domain protein [Streptomyces sp. ACT-1]MYR49313.1 RNA polymerase subunit sigma-70 [Streptomyces sp. SID4928]